ncbi:MAG: T9SS type A sorting domain-containing protein [Ignavibacteria bacterium]|nr:T9SS type A sorting domain-containing protein [Ignavibacteria bacterium]MBK9334308.1 T9SS type A sorting domain-containing protein [Ignavibacteria bacterium]
MKILLINILIILSLASFANGQNPEYLPGFPKTLDSIYYPIFYGATPIITDFDNDGQNEVMFSLFKPQHNKIYILKSDGSDLDGWPVTIFPSFSWPAIAAGDVNKDGFIDIVLRDNDSLYIFDYKGKLLPGFPVGYSTTHLSDLVLYDINNNGFLEIVIKGDNYINIIDHNGNTVSGWPRRLPGIPDRVLSPPLSVADLDNDKFAEIIVNSSQCEWGLICDSSYTHVFNHDGSNFPGWPLKSDSDYVYYSQPATLYKDKSTDSTFIFINSAHYYSNNDTARTKTSMYKINGELISKHYTKAVYESSSIAILKNNDSYYHAFGSEPLPVFLFNENNLLLNNYPVFGNGYYYNTQLLLKMNNGIFTVCYIRTIDLTLRGFVYFYDENGIQPSWSPLRPLGIPSSSGALCDLNKDGQLDFVLMTMLDTSNTSRPKINVWTFPGEVYNPKNLDWPMYGHDRYRTNQYGFIPPDEPVGIQPMNTNVPASFNLYQNFPNPFNPATSIKFDIVKKGNVRLAVFDILGRELSTLINENLNPGTFQVSFDGSGLSSGIYFCRLQSGEYINTMKMNLIK